ncbi:MAG TPA: S8 family serine peptidase [Kofleriaceae bacterium]|nr:S8 family serine peptidase [Kofleriaceae bacterium]
MTRRALRGRFVLRLVEGQELEHIATHRDVRLGAAPPAAAIDRGGAVDRAVRRHSPGLLVSRAYSARDGLLGRGAPHLAWDPVERALGMSRTFRVEVDPDAPLRPLVEDLSALGGVEMAAPEYLVESPAATARRADHDDADDHDTDAARRLIRADEALALEPGDSALIIGLVDSGVNLEHAEVQGRLRPGLSSVALAQDNLDADMVVVSGAHPRLQDVDDDQGHGTSCASIMSANGFRMARGLAGATRLLPVRALCGARVAEPGGGSRVTAVGSIQDIDSGTKSCIDLGARVLNLSFGTPERMLEPGAPVPHVEVVRYALARDCVLVAASGNSGSDERFFPAALPGVIAVGAVDAEGRPATFTTRGDHVALCAPGQGVRAARLDGYGAVNGTSFAAPFVAAAAALLLARGARRSVPLPPEAVRQILLDSVSPFPGGANAHGCGAGILDVLAALAAVDRHAQEVDEAA